MADPSHPPAEGTGGGPKDRVLDSLHGRASADSDTSGQDRDENWFALRRENQKLREVQAGQAVIEQAKGALMLRYGMDADRAHAVLVGWSRDCGIEPQTLAGTLVNVVCTGADHDPTLDPTLVRWLEEHLRHGPHSYADTAASAERPTR
ncbi:MAG TPA: ANTAR domain-containing protein [Nocardioidaceae bacterium]|nr:ANTAR domain-containing protein [Nocardioidaceae bacterium]